MPGFYLIMHMQYLDEEWFMLPYHYNDNHTYNYNLEGYAGMYSNGTRVDSTKSVTSVDGQITVDAWGTMITPTGSFPVLRVKELKNWVDSSYSWVNNSWQFQGAEPRNSTTYKFFAKNYGLVGQIDSDENRETGMSFFISQTTVGVTSHELNGNAGVYPNPASNEVTIDANDIEKIEIFNTSGQLQMVTTNPRMIDINKLKKGLYVIKVQTSKGILSSKFIKQ